MASACDGPRRPRVWHVKDPRCPPGAVLIDRQTPWGNQHRIGDPDENGERMSRITVIRRFELDLIADPELLMRGISALRGRHLRCHCAPEPCHGDIWLRLVNS